MSPSAAIPSISSSASSSPSPFCAGGEEGEQSLSLAIFTAPNCAMPMQISPLSSHPTIAHKNGIKIRRHHSMGFSAVRFGSEPELARQTPLNEFLEGWNRREEVALSSSHFHRRCSPPSLFSFDFVSSAVPSALLLTLRRSRRGRHQQNQSSRPTATMTEKGQQTKEGKRQQIICPTKGTTNTTVCSSQSSMTGQHQQQPKCSSSSATPFRQSSAAMFVPSPRSSPPHNSAAPSGGPLQFRRTPLPASWRDKVCPDGDLLPASWFEFDSNDLSRLHQKLQRRIHRRASLTRANALYGVGEADRRRDGVLQKYHRLRGGIRRALSDHQICFMDPKRDMELSEVRRRVKGASWASAPTSASASNPQKRVQFCTTPNATTCASEDEKGINGNDGNAEAVPPMRKAPQKGIRKVTKSITSSPPETPASPMKPILTRRASVMMPTVAACNGTPSPITSSSLPDSSTAFRRRISTITSPGECNEYAICTMDYATFRAWRRGSRLSVDVLNSANASPSAADPLPANANCGSALKGKSGGGNGSGCGNGNSGSSRMRMSGWLQLLKRVLADCLQHRQKEGCAEAEAEDEIGAKTVLC